MVLSSKGALFIGARGTITEFVGQNSKSKKKLRLFSKSQIEHSPPTQLPKYGSVGAHFALQEWWISQQSKNKIGNSKAISYITLIW